MKRLLIVSLTLLMLTAACGSGETATTTTDVAATNAPTSSAPTTASTEAETTTTSTPPATTPATTTASGLITLAEEKVARIEAAIPEDYTYSTGADDDGAEDNLLFTACLDENDFDLSLLGDVSVAAFDTEFEAPEAGIFGSPSGSVEVRVFKSDEGSGDAFTALENILGSESGRTCLGQQLADFMVVDMGEGAEVSVVVEEGSLPGDVATRLTLDIVFGGLEAVLYWDLVATRDAECTVFAVFQAFDEPFDEDVASTVLLAAFDG